MSGKTVSLNIDPAHELLLRQYAAFLDEVDHLAATAPEGPVLNACEKAVIKRGRDPHRRVLERAAQARLNALERGSSAESVGANSGDRLGSGSTGGEARVHVP